ncbi:2-hydroxychromene-2-carboxylate isomerase [Arenibaculum sp.]|jgi:2-hydroxychromene-2-carboxylate isomerase|uniref:2-hydroxychromene-2-carboxylate isomerase n=1 Tax=Arenibaculum sp. TaxID=2865862 RepID=UPI002E14C278|nr:2-hydroxychromene-2-carboxylate isomerase [Arenibaculum sp.]
MKQIEFWFDFASPYAYFAAPGIEDLAARHGRGVAWRPFLLGAVFEVTGMQTFDRSPLRGEYARHDWARLARRLDMPFVLPPDRPALTVAPGRAFLWLERERPDVAVAFARAVFDAYFATGLDIGSIAVTLDVAESCGVERMALEAALRSQELKDLFRSRTGEAVARGVFGSPFFFVDGEPFWGSDRLPMIDEWLARGGW